MWWNLIDLISTGLEGFHVHMKREPSPIGHPPHPICPIFQE